MPNWICRRAPLGLGQTDGAFSKGSDRNALMTKCDFPRNTSPHLRPMAPAQKVHFYKTNISKAIVRQPKKIYLAVHFIYFTHFFSGCFFFYLPVQRNVFGGDRLQSSFLTLHIVLDSTFQNPLILSSGQTDSHRWDVPL